MGYFDDIRKTVCRIPRGKIATYGEVARAAGYPGTARQVAWALRDSAIFGLPWQRVLGRGGRILLPGQAGLQQRRLLEREGVKFIGMRVDLKHYGFRFPAVKGSLPGRQKSRKINGSLEKQNPDPSSIQS